MFSSIIFCIGVSATSWVNVRVRVKGRLRVSGYGYPGGVLCIQYRSTGHRTNFVDIYRNGSGLGLGLGLGLHRAANRSYDDLAVHFVLGLGLGLGLG